MGSSLVVVFLHYRWIYCVLYHDLQCCVVWTIRVIQNDCYVLALFWIHGHHLLGSFPFDGNGWFLFVFFFHSKNLLCHQGGLGTLDDKVPSYGICLLSGRCSVYGSNNLFTVGVVFKTFC